MMIVNLGYRGVLGSSSQDHAVMGGLAVRF